MYTSASQQAGLCNGYVGWMSYRFGVRGNGGKKGNDECRCAELIRATVGTALWPGPVERKYRWKLDKGRQALNTPGW